MAELYASSELVGSRIFFLVVMGEVVHSPCSSFFLLQICTITNTSSLSTSQSLVKYTLYVFLFHHFFSCMNLFVNKIVI